MKLIRTSVLCIALSGCAPSGYDFPPPGTPYGAARAHVEVTHLIDTAAKWGPMWPLVAESEERAQAKRDDEAAIAEAEATPTYVPNVPHLPPVATVREPVHHPFDEVAARAALGSADVAPCAERGAPHGYGHARVTFAASGRAIGVLVDAPDGMTLDAAQCLGERLGEAEVPPFDGAPLVVGTSFYIH